MSAEATQPEQVASEGEAVLLSVRHTVYQHTTCVDVATGTYDMDCSGYLQYVLGNVAPLHYDLIPKETDQDRPRAFEYADYFASRPPGAEGWHRIHRLADARRGDIIAWRLDEILPDQDTGHVLIVAGNTEVVGDAVLSVPVYDSSQVPHFCDSRGHGGDSPDSGVGSGSIRFRVDYDGAPIEFLFGPDDRYHAYPIAIGRLEPLAL